MAYFKELPANREDWTLGDLIYWHVEKFGTRPHIDPQAEIGEPWDRGVLALLLDKDEKNIRNWMSDEHLPSTIEPLAAELFGTEKKWQPARRELKEKFDQAVAKRRAGQRAKRRAAAEQAASAQLPDPSASDAAAIAADGSADDAGASDTEPTSVPADATPESAPPGEAQPASEAKAALLAREEPDETSLDAEEAVPVPASSAPDADPGEPEAPTAAPSVEVEPIPASETPREDASAEAPHANTPPRRPHDAQPQSRPARRSMRAVAATLAVMLGLYGSFQVARHWSGTPSSTSEQKKKPPKTPDTPPEVVVQGPTETPATPPRPSAAGTQQTETTPVPNLRQPTEEERKLAEERRRAEQLIAAREAAHDAAERRREEEARRRDAEDTGARDYVRDRRDEARNLAGLGFSLREDMSVSASPIGHELVDSVADCALACVRNGCDGFGFYRDQLGRAAPGKRYCYFFAKPFSADNHPGYQFGEKVADPPDTPPRHPANAAPLVRLAQASGTVPLPANDLTQCASGPVKVSGFKLTCDQFTDGGTTLGSTPLRYTVANINECAAKCRPVRACTAFTFNSGDPPGRQTCILFGGRTETRAVSGWISGRR